MDAVLCAGIDLFFGIGGWAAEGAQALVRNSGITAARLVTDAMAD